MLFMQSVRENSDLAKRVEALGPQATLQQLIEIGASAGFDFTETEMRGAHARDWSMRTFRYARKDA